MAHFYQKVTFSSICFIKFDVFANIFRFRPLETFTWIFDLYVYFFCLETNFNQLSTWKYIGIEYQITLIACSEV